MSGGYFNVRPRSNAKRIGRMKGVLIAGAIGVGAFAWFLSTLHVMPDIAINILYGAGLFDAVLALVLPGIIEKKILSLCYHFYGDRMEITKEDSACIFVLPYDNIASVEEINNPSDGQMGLTGVRLRTFQPIKLPRTVGGDKQRVSLVCLPQDERPFERIKELVEKYATA